MSEDTSLQVLRVLKPCLEDDDGDHEKPYAANLQLPLDEHLDIIKIHLPFLLPQAKRLHGIHIAILVQFRERLLSIFGCRAFTSVSFIKALTSKLSKS